MIKKKIGINNDIAFIKACEDNGIVLTDKGTNSRPVSYINLKGEKRKLDTKSNINNITKDIEDKNIKEVVEFNVGDIVKVYCKVNKGTSKRIQVFEGTVIKRQNGGNCETFTVRKSSGSIGVEKTWPLYSPNVVKVEVVRRGKVRRAKRFYLRNLSGKKAKVKENIK